MTLSVPSALGGRDERVHAAVAGRRGRRAPVGRSGRPPARCGDQRDYSDDEAEPMDPVPVHSQAPHFTMDGDSGHPGDPRFQAT